MLRDRVLDLLARRGEALQPRALAGEQAWQARVPVANADGDNALSVLWAREQIAALMERMREGAPEAEIRDAVTTLALEHHLVSRFTSLVAVDRTPARTEAALKSASIATNLSEGWTYEGVYGELPRGATGLRLDVLLGTLLLLMATLLWRRARA